MHDHVQITQRASTPVAVVHRPGIVASVLAAGIPAPRGGSPGLAGGALPIGSQTAGLASGQ